MATNENNIDIQQMQREAIQRAREMQRRAQTAERPDSRPQQSASQRPHSHAPNMPPVRPQSEAAPVVPLSRPDGPKAPALFSAGEIIDKLLQDGERTLILLLIMLLSSEKCDSSLIFALLYLAM